MHVTGERRLKSLVASQNSTYSHNDMNLCAISLYASPVQCWTHNGLQLIRAQDVCIGVRVYLLEVSLLQQADQTFAWHILRFLASYDHSPLRRDTHSLQWVKVVYADQKHMVQLQRSGLDHRLVATKGEYRIPIVAGEN
jgi:hypothetical protein